MAGVMDTINGADTAWVMMSAALGLDITQHAESAYDLGGVAGGGILGGIHPSRERRDDTE